MRASRQPRVSALFRIAAGLFALMWLVGITIFSAGCVCNCGDHLEHCTADASSTHRYDTVCVKENRDSQTTRAHEHATASHIDSGKTSQDHCGKNGCEEQCRCSATIQGFAQSPPVFIIPKPVSQTVPIISLSCAVAEQVSAATPGETLRRAKRRDWVFTPAVFLGPAFRSLAPPI